MKISPKTWRERRTAKQLETLDRIFADLSFAYMELGYEGFFQVWSPKDQPENKLFISHGIRKRGKQANGNNFVTLFAFGFFYGHIARWPETYTDDMAQAAVDVYEAFRTDVNMPHVNIHADIEVEKRLVEPSFLLEELDALS